MKLIALIALIFLAACGDPTYQQQETEPEITAHHGPQVRLAEFTVTTSAIGQGNVTPPLTVPEGGNAFIDYLPASGWHIARVLVDGVALAPTPPYYVFTGIKSDHTITVVFEADNAL